MNDEVNADLPDSELENDGDFAQVEIELDDDTALRLIELWLEVHIDPASMSVFNDAKDADLDAAIVAAIKNESIVAALRTQMEDWSENNDDDEVPTLDNDGC